MAGLRLHVIYMECIQAKCVKSEPFGPLLFFRYKHASGSESVSLGSDFRLHTFYCFSRPALRDGGLSCRSGWDDEKAHNDGA